MNHNFRYRLFLLFQLLGIQITMNLFADKVNMPPNIILMMADDMGLGDTSAYQDLTGNLDGDQLHTPQMERLAAMGVRLTDAHSPSSRCTTTRYSLLTGRYSWRTRLKHWVLFGAQGDPLIELDRPTVATLLGGAGYHTAIVGKWHLGLRYRSRNGGPASGWMDADLTQPLYTSPLDYGFDFVRITSRSHGTSGPNAGSHGRHRNGPKQTVGPGHIHGRTVMSASGEGHGLEETGPHAYILGQLGSRHSESVMHFLGGHLEDKASRKQPFFLYYPLNANHGPYTPDTQIGGRIVAGAARTKTGISMDARYDFIYENDVALGRLLDWLEETLDPRRPGHRLVENTLVIFTSDNGAEIKKKSATGPFRSNKGSVYEGGHRIPFLATWPAGGIGDTSSTGGTVTDLVGLQDIYATFAAILDIPLPQFMRGEKGAEDSFSILSALRGKGLSKRPPLFINDHKERKDDPAACALRLDHPLVAGRLFPGQWKLIMDARLIREGQAHPLELFNLAEDPMEATNLLLEPDLKSLVEWLKSTAEDHRNAGGHRMVSQEKPNRVMVRMSDGVPSPEGSDVPGAWTFSQGTSFDALNMWMEAERLGVALKSFPGTIQEGGLGLDGGHSSRVDSGESLLLHFDRDVVLESLAIRVGKGVCGGYYRIGNGMPMAIYGVDADNDVKEQQGVLSDLGFLAAGEVLRLDTRPLLGVEPEGAWRLEHVKVRLLP